MNLVNVLIALWVFLPALLVGFVWWSWEKRIEKKGWRQAATLVSASAITANVALMLGTLGSTYLDHQSMPVAVTLAGLAICISSIIAAPVGVGRLRWLAVPAAVVQGIFWLVAWLVSGPRSPIEM